MVDDKIRQEIDDQKAQNGTHIGHDWIPTQTETIKNKPPKQHERSNSQGLGMSSEAAQQTAKYKF